MLNPREPLQKALFRDHICSFGTEHPLGRYAGIISVKRADGGNHKAISSSNLCKLKGYCQSQLYSDVCNMTPKAPLKSEKRSFFSLLEGDLGQTSSTKADDALKFPCSNDSNFPLYKIPNNHFGVSHNEVRNFVNLLCLTHLPISVSMCS